MNIQVSPRNEQVIERLIAGGDYTDADDVLSEALELLEKRRRFQGEVEQSLAELDRGERIPADEVFEEIYAKAATMKNSE